MKLIFKIFTVLVVTIILIGILGFGFFYWAMQPVNMNDSQKVSFVIPKGQASSIIAQRLQEQGFVKNALVFRFVVWKNNIAGKIQAGTFKLSPSQTSLEIAQTLTQGTEDVWITIPEGWRKEEIAQMLEESLGDSFDTQEFLTLAEDSEGYLFPDTYLLPQETTAQLVYDLLTTTFKTKYKTLNFNTSNSSLSKNEVVTLASLLEREAQSLEDMKMVSGILQNRLEIGMALQVDATLQYAKGYNKIHQNWWKPPTATDKEIDSPFNTYKNTGLPPHPICNPGLNALKAVMEPTDSEYIFYITDMKGNMHYAKTLDEHNANVRKYLK